MHSDEGVKFDTGKRRFSLLPWSSVTAIVDVLEHGAEKYCPDNWKHVDGAQTRYFDACLRHLTAWWEGERADPDSGLSHLAHAGCCILFLLWFDREDRT